ncbi:MAG: hypothetical protein WC901_08080 [Candidatus Margulisiibacteriota bacterium]
MPALKCGEAMTAMQPIRNWRMRGLDEGVLERRLGGTLGKLKARDKAVVILTNAIPVSRSTPEVTAEHLGLTRTLAESENVRLVSAVGLAAIADRFEKGAEWLAALSASDGAVHLSPIAEAVSDIAQVHCDFPFPLCWLRATELLQSGAREGSDSLAVLVARTLRDMAENRRIVVTDASELESVLAAGKTVTLRTPDLQSTMQGMRLKGVNVVGVGTNINFESIYTRRRGGLRMLLGGRVYSTHMPSRMLSVSGAFPPHFEFLRITGITRGQTAISIKTVLVSRGSSEDSSANIQPEYDIPWDRIVSLQLSRLPDYDLK